MIMKRSSWNLFAHSLSLSWISFPRQKTLPHSLTHLKTTATDSCRHFNHYFYLFHLFVWFQSLCMQFTLFYLQLQLIIDQLNSADTRTTNHQITSHKITKSPVTKDREEKRQNQWCLQIAGSTWLPVDPRSNKMPQLHHLSVISPGTSRVDFGYHWKQAELTLDITGEELTLDIMLLHPALRVLTHVCDDGVN